MYALIAAGLALLAISYSPLHSMWAERGLQRELQARFSVEQIGRDGGDLSGRIGDHQVALEDDAGTSANYADRVQGPVRVLIDGRDYSSRAPVAIRTSQRDGNRYWGYVALRRLVDRDRATERLVVTQNTGGGRYRSTSIDRDGHIDDETFGYGDRCAMPVRALLIRPVSPHPVGVCSDIATGLPGLWFPLVYPLGTALAGLIALFAGVVMAAGRTMKWAARGSNPGHPD